MDAVAVYISYYISNITRTITKLHCNRGRTATPLYESSSSNLNREEIIGIDDSRWEPHSSPQRQQPGKVVMAWCHHAEKTSIWQTLRCETGFLPARIKGKQTPVTHKPIKCFCQRRKTSTCIHSAENGNRGRTHKIRGSLIKIKGGEGYISTQINEAALLFQVSYLSAEIWEIVESHKTNKNSLLGRKQ